MNLDKHISLLKADKRINDIHIKNVISALHLNDNIKEDEKQLRRLINSDRNFNGCNLTAMLIKDLSSFTLDSGYCNMLNGYFYQLAQDEKHYLNK